MNLDLESSGGAEEGLGPHIAFNWAVVCDPSCWVGLSFPIWSEEAIHPDIFGSLAERS